MTMPKGWLPPERKIELTDAEKKEKEKEEAKLLDYYNQFIKPSF